MPPDAPVDSPTLVKSACAFASDAAETDVVLRRDWDTYQEPGLNAVAEPLVLRAAPLDSVAELGKAFKQANENGGVAAINSLSPELEEALRNLALEWAGARRNSVEDYNDGDWRPESMLELSEDNDADGCNDRQEPSSDTWLSSRSDRADSGEEPRTQFSEQLDEGVDRSVSISPVLVGELHLHRLIDTVCAKAKKEVLGKVLDALWGEIGAGFGASDVVCGQELLGKTDSRQHRRSSSGGQLDFGPATLVLVPPTEPHLQVSQRTETPLQVYSQGAWRQLQLQGNGPAVIVLIGICAEWRSNERLNACKYRLSGPTMQAHPSLRVALKDSTVLKPHTTRGEPQLFATVPVGDVDKRVQSPGGFIDAQEQKVVLAKLYKTGNKSNL